MQTLAAAVFKLAPNWPRLHRSGEVATHNRW